VIKAKKLKQNQQQKAKREKTVFVEISCYMELDGCLMVMEL